MNPLISKSISFLLIVLIHKYYVSSTLIDYSSDSNTHQVSLKIFHDDLEKDLGFETNELDTSSATSVCSHTPRATLGAPKGLPKVMENHSDWRRNEWYISLSIWSRNGPSKALSEAARMPQGVPQILPMAENATKTNGFSMILEGPKGGQRGPEGHPGVLRAA